MKIINVLNKSIFFTFILFAFVLVACKDDDDKQPVTEDTNQIVGKWQLTAITPETQGTTIAALEFLKASVPCLYDLKLTFNSNNTVTPSDCDAAVSAIAPFVPVGTDAKWKVEGDKLILTSTTTTQEFKIIQNPSDMTIIVNTNTDATKPAVNALLLFKRL